VYLYSAHIPSIWWLKAALLRDGVSHPGETSNLLPLGAMTLCHHNGAKKIEVTFIFF